MYNKKMASVNSDFFSSEVEATAYLKLLHQQKQKTDLKDALSTINIADLKVPDVIEVADSIILVLQQVKIPLSISFLNSTFASWGKRGIINERFLRENQDKFAIFVVGSDLKVQLRNGDVKSSSVEPKNYFQLLQIVQKDLTKLKTLQYSFQQQEITDIPYEDFIRKFSSNKNKMNLSFIVRNSHALKVFSRGRTTLVKYHQEDNPINDNPIDMSEREVWEKFIGEGLEHFLVVCLERLLRNFFRPINQGTLQACFNIGSFGLDKNFLNNHRELFEGFGADGVILVDNQTSDVEEKQDIIGKFTKASVISKEPFTTTPDLPCNEESLVTSVQKALGERRSVIVLGDHQLNPYIADAVNTNAGQRLMALQRIKDVVEKRMSAISQGVAEESVVYYMK